MTREKNFAVWIFLSAALALNAVNIVLLCNGQVVNSFPLMALGLSLAALALTSERNSGGGEKKETLRLEEAACLMGPLGKYMTDEKYTGCITVCESDGSVRVNGPGAGEVLESGIKLTQSEMDDVRRGMDMLEKLCSQKRKGKIKKLGLLEMRFGGIVWITFIREPKKKPVAIIEKTGGRTEEDGDGSEHVRGMCCDAYEKGRYHGFKDALNKADEFAEKSLGLEPEKKKVFEAWLEEQRNWNILYEGDKK